MARPAKRYMGSPNVGARGRDQWFRREQDAGAGPVLVARCSCPIPTGSTICGRCGEAVRWVPRDEEPPLLAGRNALE